jgi:hypothetical protein
MRRRNSVMGDLHDEGPGSVPWLRKLKGGGFWPPPQN